MSYLSPLADLKWTQTHTETPFSWGPGGIVVGRIGWGTIPADVKCEVLICCRQRKTSLDIISLMALWAGLYDDLRYIGDEVFNAVECCFLPVGWYLQKSFPFIILEAHVWSFYVLVLHCPTHTVKISVNGVFWNLVVKLPSSLILGT